MSLNTAITLIAGLMLSSASSYATQSSQPTAQDGIYSFTRETEIVSDGVKTSADSEEDITMVFAKDEPVAVKFGNAHNVLLTPLLAEEERGEVPAEIEISQNEFNAAHMQFVREGDEALMSNLYSAYQPTDLASRGSSRAGYHHHARRHGYSRHYAHMRGRMHWHGTSGCVAYVLSHLGVEVHGNGRDIARGLVAKRGWHWVSCSNPPPRTVASWSGGSGAGHTGLWNGRGFCYDLGCHDPGRRYHLLGCAAPPGYHEAMNEQ